MPFNTAANQSSSETLSLANPCLRPSLNGLIAFPSSLNHSFLVFLSLSCVLRDLTIILHNWSVCKEGVGVSVSIPQSFETFFFCIKYAHVGSASGEEPACQCRRPKRHRFNDP